QRRGVPPHRLSLWCGGAATHCGGVRDAEDAAGGRLVAPPKLNLACASQRCDHAFDRHAFSIVGIGERCRGASLLAYDKSSWNGKHPGGIALVTRDIPTGR